MQRTLLAFLISLVPLLISSSWQAEKQSPRSVEVKLAFLSRDVLLGQKTLCSAILGRVGKYFSHARQLLSEAVARIMNNEVSLSILVGEGIEQTPVYNA